MAKCWYVTGLVLASVGTVKETFCQLLQRNLLSSSCGTPTTGNWTSLTVDLGVLSALHLIMCWTEFMQLLGVRPSVYLSVLSNCCMLLLHVCCCGAGRQEISIHCYSSSGRMRGVYSMSHCQCMFQLNTNLFSVKFWACNKFDLKLKLRFCVQQKTVLALNLLHSCM